MKISIYVCPTDGCTNYYGSSSMGDMSEVVAKVGANFEPRGPSAWHARAACPDCRTKGIMIDRELVTMVIPSASAKTQEAQAAA